MIVLPVSDPGPDVTWIVVGFLLGFIWLGINTVAWWTEALRNDRQEFALAADATALAAHRAANDGELADIRGDLAAIATYLGIEITEDDDMPADTDEIPTQERPRPTPGPRTQPTEVAAVVAVTADDWLDAWRRDTDRELAAMRERWDAA